MATAKILTLDMTGRWTEIVFFTIQEIIRACVKIINGGLSFAINAPAPFKELSCVEVAPRSSAMRCISYKDGYKYQLAQDYVVYTGIAPPAPVNEKFYAMDPHGRLTIRHGYAWDGPSGPTIDTHNFMRGSLVHDALYQMIREGYLSPVDAYREPADRLLQNICKEDGMTALRAWWVYKGVRFGGGNAAMNGKPLIHSPQGCP